MKKGFLKIVSSLMLVISVSVIGFNYAQADEISITKKNAGEYVTPLFSSKSATGNDQGYSENTADKSYLFAEVTDISEKTVTVLLTISNVDGVKDAQYFDSLISFTDEINNNFSIELVNDNLGSKNLNPVNNQISWINSINLGDAAKLEYKLTLKDDYSESILNKELFILKSVTVADDASNNFMGYGPDNTDCAIPSIIITNNPKTAIFADYAIIGLVAVSSIALIITVRNKSKFSRI